MPFPDLAGHGTVLSWALLLALPLTAGLAYAWGAARAREALRRDLRQAREAQRRSEQLQSGWHWQTALRQPPPVHAVPHAPQLAWSALRFTQRFPHLVNPVGHAIWHAPAEHIRPGPHALLHAPQLAGSTWVSTQTPLQLVLPGPH